jgi:Flp pilus assembly protein TadD
MRRPAAVANLVAVIAVAAATAGCASWRAARLYQGGTDALDRGAAAEAVVDLERAASLRPEASEIWNHLGLAYAAAGRSPEARRAFERAVALDCENAAARHNLRVAERAAAHQNLLSAERAP